jgi:hypothetical protein
MTFDPEVSRGREAFDSFPRVSWKGTIDAVSNGTAFRRNRHVTNAQGMVAGQMDCTLDEALQLMKARAHATNLSLEEVAIAVIERRIRFDE